MGLVAGPIICVVRSPGCQASIGEALVFRKNFTASFIRCFAARFKAVFDTTSGGRDIMESRELKRGSRRQEAASLITTCCPSWVDFMEKFHTDMIDNFSSCKSPHEILGVLSKTYYAQKNKIDPSKIVMVSIMPCTSKKYEIGRCDEMHASGYQDVDIVLTTRELAGMIKQAGIDFINLPDSEPDSILGDYSGAA
jgi:NADH-quinone oxidoreductase subunit G